MHPTTALDEAAAAPAATIPFSALPALGAPWPSEPGQLSIGTFVGLISTPEGDHCALVRLHDQPPRERMPWADCMAWAASIAADLPTRDEMGAIRARAAAGMTAGWYWTCEQYSARYAWYQSVPGGSQYDDVKAFEGRAVAVRRFKLSA